jgi:hypothetical protein
MVPDGAYLPQAGSRLQESRFVSPEKVNHLFFPGFGAMRGAGIEGLAALPRNKRPEINLEAGRVTWRFINGHWMVSIRSLYLSINGPFSRHAQQEFLNRPRVPFRSAPGSMGLRANALNAP